MDTFFPKINIIGAKEVIDKLEKQKLSAVFKMNDAVHQAGFFLQSEVKASIAGQRSEPASVDTGHFMQSVETDNSIQMQSTVKSEVEYAKFLEYGTSKMAARRHFLNSAARNASKINEFVKNAVNDNI